MTKLRRTPALSGRGRIGRRSRRRSRRRRSGRSGRRSRWSRRGRGGRGRRRSRCALPRRWPPRRRCLPCERWWATGTGWDARRRGWLGPEGRRRRGTGRRSAPSLLAGQRLTRLLRVVPPALPAMLLGPTGAAEQGDDREDQSDEEQPKPADKRPEEHRRRHSELGKRQLNDREGLSGCSVTVNRVILAVHCVEPSNQGEGLPVDVRRLLGAPR